MVNNFIALQQGGNAGVINIVMIVLLIAIFYFFMIRPQQKKQKEIKQFREGLSVGDRVITAGGIYGKIRGVKDTTFVLEIADGVRSEITYPVNPGHKLIECPYIPVYPVMNGLLSI